MRRPTLGRRRHDPAGGRGRPGDDELAEREQVTGRLRGVDDRPRAWGSSGRSSVTGWRSRWRRPVQRRRRPYPPHRVIRSGTSRGSSGPAARIGSTRTPRRRRNLDAVAAPPLRPASGCRAGWRPPGGHMVAVIRVARSAAFSGGRARPRRSGGIRATTPRACTTAYLSSAQKIARQLPAAVTSPPTTRPAAPAAAPAALHAAMARARRRSVPATEISRCRAEGTAVAAAASWTTWGCGQREHLEPDTSVTTDPAAKTSRLASIQRRCHPVAQRGTQG